MLGVVDADTHIAESERMWDLIDAEMRPRRPVLLSLPDDTLYKDWNATWLIDGNIFPKPVGKGGFRLITPSAAKNQLARKDINLGCRELTDIPARLADMDRAGIAAQVVYPTLFLIYLTDDAELDVALCRAYNRFMADACAKSNSRIRWVVVPPLRSIENRSRKSKRRNHKAPAGCFSGAWKATTRWTIRTFSPSIKQRWTSICRSASTPAPAPRPSRRCSI